MVQLDDTTPTGSAEPSDGWYGNLELWRRGLDKATQPNLRRMVVSHLDPPLSRRVTGEHDVIDVVAVDAEDPAGPGLGSGPGAGPGLGTHTGRTAGVPGATRRPRLRQPRDRGRRERPGLLPTTPMLSMTRRTTGGAGTGAGTAGRGSPHHSPYRPPSRARDGALDGWPPGTPPHPTDPTDPTDPTTGANGTTTDLTGRTGRTDWTSRTGWTGRRDGTDRTGQADWTDRTGQADWTDRTDRTGWTGGSTSGAGWPETGLRPTGLVRQPTRPLSIDLAAARTRARLARLGRVAGLLLALGLAWLVLVTLRSPGGEDAPVDVIGTRINDTVVATLLADRTLSVVAWVASVATTLVLGGVIFRVFVMGARVPAASPGDRSAGLRVLRAAAMVGIAAGLASLPLRAASVSDAGFPAAWDLETLRFVLTGRFGDAALVRIAGLALLAGFLPVLPIGPASRRPEPDGPGGAGPYGSANGHRLTGRRPRGRRVRGRGARAAGAGVGGVADRLVLERIACLVGGLIVLLSYAIVGHPQSSAPSFVLIPAQCIHVAVVSTWFGGVTFLALELRHQRREGTARGFGEVVARFSTVASVTVALAGATGATMAWSQLHTLDALTSTAYGRALLAKLTVLAVPLALGFYNRQRLVPAIVGRDEAAAWRQIRLTLTLEALFIALGVLLATAAMTSGGFP